MTDRTLTAALADALAQRDGLGIADQAPNPVDALAAKTASDLAHTFWLASMGDSETERSKFNNAVLVVLEALKGAITGAFAENGIIGSPVVEETVSVSERTFLARLAALAAATGPEGRA